MKKTLTIMTICFLSFLNITSINAQWWNLTGGNAVTGAEYLGASSGAFPLDIKHVLAQPINFHTNNIFHTTLDPNGNFSIGQTNAFNYFGIGANSVLWHAGDITSIFVGVGSGNVGLIGATSGNTCVGQNTASSATPSCTNNVFVGTSAGTSATATGGCTFMGYQAGYNSIFGDANTYVGNSSGWSETGSGGNAFFGNLTGTNNLGGSLNSFIGAYSGQNNSTGSGNSFLGFNSAATNTVGRNNTILGYLANTLANNLDNATAIGANAVVANNYTMILGDVPVNVGIGLSGVPAGPQAKLNVENDASPSVGNPMPIGGLFNTFGNASAFVVTTAVTGNNLTTGNPTNYGGRFYVANASVNIGVHGWADNNAQYNFGVMGDASRAVKENTGVYGNASNSKGTNNYGGHFQAMGNVLNGTNYAVKAEAQGGLAGGIQNFGVFSVVYPGIPMGAFPMATDVAIYGNAQILSAPPIPGNSWAGYFDGDVNVNGTCWNTGGGAWLVSDQQFKNHIDSIPNSLLIIKSLKPRTFFMDTLNPYGMPFPSEKQYGFIAQDVQQVLPELVKGSRKPAMVDSLGNILTPSVDFIGLNYTEFIPLLTRGIQEQQRTIDSMKKDMQDLRDMINDCCNANHSHGSSTNPTNTGNIANTDVKLTDVQNIVLENNKPNPFNEQTTIGYSLPDNTGKAEMLFYNASGRLIQSVELTNKGKGQVNVFAQDLSNGIYTYTLVVDGKIFETKKMVKQ